MARSDLRLWVRWSLRDLRSRWVQVLAIALVIALGSGSYAGLRSDATWRRQNYDASFAVTDVHDLVVRVANGGSVPRADLDRAIGAVPEPGRIAGVTDRLVVPIQVDASRDGRTILVPGRIVGVDLTDGGPTIDRLAILGGRGLTAADDGQPVVVLDQHVADRRELAAPTTVTLSGDRQVQVVGTGVSPQYFLIMSEEGELLTASGYAVAFAGLTTAQQLAGTPGAVSEAGVEAAPGTDIGALRRDLQDTLARELPGTAVTVVALTDERPYRTMYDDIDSDQRMYSVFALLILFGAAFAAFNLTGRMVEAQRREIGIGMALGLPARRIAVRPLLVAAEVAVLGAVLGIGVGLAVGAVMSGVMTSFFPLPVWSTPLQVGIFATATALAIGLVVAASVWPVWRAVRVPPVDALQTGARATRRAGLAPALVRLKVPGPVIALMPVRGVLRAPRRTLLTAFGIAAAIATLIGVRGMIDSFIAVLDHAEAEITNRSPDRFDVGFSSYTLEGAPVVQAVRTTPGVAEVSTGLRLGGTLRGEQGVELESLVDLIDMDNPIWAPGTIEGTVHSDTPGIVIAEKAATDLGVGPGDTLRFRHPMRQGLGYTWVEGSIPVIGVHDFPYRFVSFMDLRHAGYFGTEGIVNFAQVAPAPETDRTALQRQLFTTPGVASVEPATALVTTIRDVLNQVLQILALVEAVVLLLALLIAFNATSINADERRREHATMFAYGVPVRSVLGMSVFESTLTGVLGTAMGIGLGLLILEWMIRRLIPEVQPDLAVAVAVRPSTFLLAALLGVVVVALAPVLTVRKLRRMDVPSTLRVVE
ncbi:MAG: FtsX-like permease family protein [Acidimicrobiales bacterium]